LGSLFLDRQGKGFAQVVLAGVVVEVPEDVVVERARLWANERGGDETGDESGAVYVLLVGAFFGFWVGGSAFWVNVDWRATKFEKGIPAVDRCAKFILVPLFRAWINLVPRPTSKATSLSRKAVVDRSHISIIILQVKNKKMDSCSFPDEKFDITHINDLYASPTKRYLGIWMPLGTSMEDLTIETGKPIKSRIPIVSMLTEIDPAIPSQTLKNKTPSRRGPPRASKSYIESATNPRKPPKRARTDDGENIGAEPREDKLRFRLRGFRSTYNSTRAAGWTWALYRSSSMFYFGFGFILRFRIYSGCFYARILEHFFRRVE
jgi:hypothetical protein